VTFVWAVLSLAASLALQAALGRLVPQAQRFVDVLLWPVAWYAVARSQRSAMLVGCAAGLLQDAWFQTGVFGIHGFSKTLAGWAVGGLGARFELNHFWGRLLGGGTLFLADRLIEIGLLLLLDLAVAEPVPLDFGVGAGANGLLVAAAFAIVQRVRGRDAVRRPARRRA
jgi:rod shape-determining protein MreD